ncbi:MAG: EAL domain-containing protein [Gammaproteobacteria bacterium]|nr:EAL domain-containing protein [Gammaproteobacteria bacterium]
MRVRLRSLTLISTILLLLAIIFSGAGINPELFSLNNQSLQQIILLTLGIFFVITLTLGYQFIRHIEQQNIQLSHKAHHDDLTQLPNRAFLYREIDAVIEHSRLNESPLVLCIIDLNRFKEVNDTLGHHAGDELLKEVSNRITGTLRKRDILARLGGDEFALLLPDTTIEEAVCCMERINDCLEKNFVIANIDLEIRASMGLSSFPEHGSNASTLLQHADTAMYQSKKTNSPYSVYEKTEDPHSVQRLALRSGLRQAIENDELLLHFQPKIDLHRKKITSVEALVRWQHPEYGFISPDEFIPIAEQNGLINALTMWVLNDALHQCSIWRNKGIFINMAFNLSARSLQDISIPKQIDTLLKKWGLPANCLVLEVTESAMMKDIVRAKEILDKLDVMGVTLSIDDFGTGFSSLSYLNQLPVDELKIDRSFVTDMTRNENNAIIVRSIIDLAHNMGRSVVAEGVEDKETLNVLEILGCDVVQGYLFSRPLPAEKLEAWLHDSRWGISKENVRLIKMGDVQANAVLA